MRWFVAGDLPADLRPDGPSRCRVDSYCIPSLSPVSSLKRRGGQRPELKVRVGRVELMEHRALVGFAERWSKQRLVDAPRHVASGPWLGVQKQVWSFAGGEVARLAVGGARWWTLAVVTGHAGSSGDSIRLFDSWVDAVVAGGTPHSYPSWLTGVSGPGDSRDAVA
jgi:hypothetical protein